jgi:predicted O-linked N-acetylglucosamine transferase (SPINDLY family)
LYQLQQSYEDEVAAKNCVLEQVMKLEQALEDTAIKSFNNEKQLKEVEEAAVTTKDYFQEQVCQLEKALHDTAENSLLLEQQVGALSFPKFLCGV